MECQICLDDDAQLACFICTTCKFTVCQTCYSYSMESMAQPRLCFNVINDEVSQNAHCSETIISSLKRTENIPCIKVYLKHGIRENFIQNFSSILARKHFMNDELYFDDLNSMIIFKNKLTNLYQKEDIISLAPIIANFNIAIEKDERIIKYYGHATVKRLINKSGNIHDYAFGDDEDVEKYKTSSDPVFSAHTTKTSIVNKKCMAINCSGTLYSDKNICMICTKITCNVCLVEKTENHVCIKEENEVFENSRQCQMCSMIIYRIAGCNHMSCGSCGFRFNWETGIILGFSFDGNAYGTNSFKSLNVLKSEALIISDSSIIKKISRDRISHGIDPFRVSFAELPSQIEILLSSVHPYVSSEKLEELKSMYVSKIGDTRNYGIYGIDSYYYPTPLIVSPEYKKLSKADKDIFLIKSSMHMLKDDSNASILKIDDVHLKYMTQTINLAHWTSSSTEDIFVSWFDELIDISLLNSGKKLIFDELERYILNPTSDREKEILSLIQALEKCIDFKFNITSLNFSGFNLSRRVKAQLMMM